MTESKTPLMDAFAKELDQFWQDAHAGRLVFTETEKRLAKRLLELYPDNLLTNPKK